VTRVVDEVTRVVRVVDEVTRVVDEVLIWCVVDADSELVFL
jgi:hypothetical protein